MFRLVLWFLLVVFLLGCGGGDSVSVPENPNIPPETTVSNTIEGRWVLAPLDGGCTETYQFNSDLTWEMTFNDQVSRGTYQFQEQVNEGDMHSLTFNITSHAPNPCGRGSAIIDAVGLPPFYFVSFPEKNEMSWFRAAEGVESVGDFVMEVSTSSSSPKVVNRGDLVSFQAKTELEAGSFTELLNSPGSISNSSEGEISWVAKQARGEVDLLLSKSTHTATTTRQGHDDNAVANFISKQVKNQRLIAKGQVITLLNIPKDEYIQQWDNPSYMVPNKVTYYDLNQSGLHNIIAMTTDKVISIDPLANESEFVLPIELFEQVYGTQFVDFVIDDLDNDGDADIVLLLSCGNSHFDFKGVILVWDTGSQSISYQRSLLSQSSRIKIGSVTGDGSKQIVLNSGVVFDVGLNMLEWHYSLDSHSQSLGELFILADIDSDNTDEIILFEPKDQYVDNNIKIIKYGIDTPIEKLMLPAPICSLRVASPDIDNDKILLTGSCIDDKLTAYSATDMKFLWNMSTFSSSSIKIKASEPEGSPLI